MIGSRAVVTGAVAAAGITVLLGAGMPRPEVAAGASVLVVVRADAAEAALADLDDRLAPAVDAARSGAARVVDGDEAPGPPLLEAAALLREAVEAAVAASEARAELASAVVALDPEGAALPPAPDPAELESIAAQLEASAEAGDAFAEMRRRADSVTVELEAALGALEDGDLDQAERHVTAARAAHDAVAGWEVDFVTLPLWVETADAMIRAVERLIEATRAADAEAAAEAAADVEAVADDAATADRALRIAMAEGGAAVTVTPLSRLAAVLAMNEELRVAIESARASAVR
jgi:hypothetical protein